ncbi:SWIM zinc finger family protein [uncultured Psychromonas sp.]|uniref:SWIM zinc finger family protein n=1 Tax=uncultured Psychromonas sp. TaxID=173974 RepID=UPI00345B3F9E
MRLPLSPEVTTIILLYKKDDSIHGETLQVRCKCPASAYQDICKHAVAVALSVDNTPRERARIRRG